MITQLKGRLVEKSPTDVVIDCNGVGYMVHISLNTFSKLTDSESITLFTHLQVKEDSNTLFGFYEKTERNLFRQLISVSGIGASTARTMLSSLTPKEIQSAIISEILYSFFLERAKEVLGKVAKVVLEKPEIEFLVEGHTDDQSIQNEVLIDNWDLSVKRATSVVRVLQNDFGVQPERMTAAGRSFYVPVADNDTAENRSKNRRTRIVVLPKLDQFYDLIEQGMKGGTN